MQVSRRDLLLSIAAGTAVAACGGGGSEAGTRASGTIGGGTDGSGDPGSGSGGSNANNGIDALFVNTITPDVYPDASDLPVPVVVQFTYDLESTDIATIYAGYQTTAGMFMPVGPGQSISRKAAGTGSLGFALPTSALSSPSLAIGVILTDLDRNSLAISTKVVARG